MQWFRGELVFKVRRFCVSRNSRLESHKEEEDASPILVQHAPDLIAELDKKGVVERVVEVLPELNPRLEIIKEEEDPMPFQHISRSLLTLSPSLTERAL